MWGPQLVGNSKHIAKMSHNGKDPPDLPGKTTGCDFSSITVSLIKLADSHPLGYSTGKMGLMARQAQLMSPWWRFWQHVEWCKGSSMSGGDTQLTSPPQSYVKVSTASVPGHQNRELNYGNWVLRSFANLSIMHGPHCRSTAANTAGWIILSRFSVWVPKILKPSSLPSIPS